MPSDTADSAVEIPLEISEENISEEPSPELSARLLEVLLSVESYRLAELKAAYQGGLSDADFGLKNWLEAKHFFVLVYGSRSAPFVFWTR